METILHAKTRAYSWPRMCLMGMRVIIPPSLRNRLLLELHEEHPGIVAMKSIARSYIWWPNFGCRNWVDGEKLWSVSSSAEGTTQYTTVPMEVAYSGVAKSTPRIFREGRQLLPWVGWQPFQVDRGSTHEIHNCSKHYWPNETLVCGIWFAWRSCFR